MAKTAKANGDAAAATPNTNAKKFIGLRVENEKAEQLQELANVRGVSLNELVNSLIDELQDPEKITVERVDKGMNQQQDKADDLHKNLDQLHALLRLQEHLAEERKDLEGKKPEGVFENLFSSKRLEEWNTKAKALEEKYKRLGDKIAVLRDKVLAEELEQGDESSTSTSRPRKKNSEDATESKDKDDPGSRRSPISDFLNRPIFR